MIGAINAMPRVVFSNSSSQSSGPRSCGSAACGVMLIRLGNSNNSRRISKITEKSSMDATGCS